MNGNFECGLAPWVANAGIFNTFEIVSNYYFEYKGPGYYNPGSTIPSLQQQIALTVGQAYTVTFTTYFQYCSGETTLKSFLADITDCQFPAGTPHTNTLNFIAKQSSALFEFDFIDSSHSGTYQTIQISNGMYISPEQLRSAEPDEAGTRISDFLRVDSILSSDIKPETDYSIVSIVPASTNILSSLLATSTVPSSTTAATTATFACNTASPIIQNGGFESGSLSPWIVKSGLGQSYGNVVAGGSNYFAGSGSSYTGGNYAFSANLYSPNYPYAGSVSQTLSQTLNTCAGTNYTVTTDYNFESSSGCSISFDYTKYASSSTSARGWQRMAWTFTASSNTYVIQFVLSCAPNPGQIELDYVNITKTITSQ